jgi:hypothetical protein
MANPFPFVSGAVLTAAELNGIGEFTTYTPTFTNLTVGNGTLTAYYARIQDFVSVFVDVTFGSTSSVSGDVSFTLPFNRDTTSAEGLGTVLMRDIGTGNYVGQVLPLASAGSVTVKYAVVGGAGPVTLGNLNATTPFTWANTDVFAVSFTYRKD